MPFGFNSALLSTKFIFSTWKKLFWAKFIKALQSYLDRACSSHFVDTLDKLDILGKLDKLDRFDRLYKLCRLDKLYRLDRLDRVDWSCRCG